MRQIEAIGQVLGEILRLALGGRRTEALGLFDRAYRPLLGVGAKVAGTLSDAEDALFEAIDASPGDSGPVDAGIAFYRRLLALGDAAMRAGNLPRDEVEA